MRVPSDTLLLPLARTRRLLCTEGGAWCSELVDVAVEVDFGAVVVSDAMEVLPLSELADQLPEEE